MSEPTSTGLRIFISPPMSSGWWAWQIRDETGKTVKTGSGYSRLSAIRDARQEYRALDAALAAQEPPRRLLSWREVTP